MRALILFILIAFSCQALAGRHSKTVGTIAEMKALSVRFGCTNAIVTDPEVGGSFVLVPGKVGVNNFLKYDSTTSSYSWLRVYSGPVNVRWAGAKGDGRADDTMAFQIVVNSGGTVMVPCGTFLLTSTVHVTRDGTRIVGMGQGLSGTMIRFSGTGPAFAFHAISTNDLLHRCSLSDMVINMTQTNGAAVAFYRPSESVLENCYVENLSSPFDNQTEYQVVASGKGFFGTGMLIRNCRVNWNKYGIKFDGNGNEYLTRCVISDTEVHGSTITKSNSVGIWLQQSSGCQVVRGNLEDLGVGVFLNETINASLRDVRLENVNTNWNFTTGCFGSSLLNCQSWSTGNRVENGTFSFRLYGMDENLNIAAPVIPGLK